MESIKEKQKKTFETLKGDLGYRNVNQAPQLEKVVINVGTGKMRDKDKNDFVSDRLAKITGQHPSLRSAKQSIASFKLRQGEPIGVTVTLRGARMYGFLDKLFNVVFPRTKDFRGLERKAIDDMGNYTIGIKEHSVFPETSDEELRNLFGMSITLVTTAKSKGEAEKFLELIGVPFKK